MKSTVRTLALVALAIVPITAMTAETEVAASAKRYEVVFEVTAEGAEKWLGVMRNVENTQKSLGAEAVRLEVVVHGKALGMLLADKVDEHPELREKLSKLHEDGVIFAACENTMRRHEVEKDDLVQEATTVDSGVGEVVRKQSDGYSYIKIGE